MLFVSQIQVVVLSQNVSIVKVCMYYCLLMCCNSWMGFQSETAGDTEAATGKEVCSTKCKGVRVTYL